MITPTTIHTVRTGVRRATTRTYDRHHPPRSTRDPGTCYVSPSRSLSPTTPPDQGSGGFSCTSTHRRDYDLHPPSNLNDSHCHWGSLPESPKTLVYETEENKTPIEGVTRRGQQGGPYLTHSISRPLCRCDDPGRS